MNLHYRIVEVWPNDHLIVVRYWTDVISEEMIATDQNRNEDGTPVRCRSDVSITVPIPEPSEDDLHGMITRNAPTAWLKTLEDVLDPNINTDLSTVRSMFNKKFTKDLNDFYYANHNVPSAVSLSDQEILDIISKATQKSNTTY